MNKDLLPTFLNLIFNKNIVLYHLLGICPILLYRISLKESLKIGIIITLMMLINVWVVSLTFLTQFYFAKFRILLTILIVYLIMHFTKVILTHYKPSFAYLFDKYPEFFYTNYALYGTTIMNIKINNPLFMTLNSISAGIGYLILLIVFMPVKERMLSSKKSSQEKNIALELIILGLMSMLFMNITF
jgi:Na+-translocating ferredoxin:NAD+ oxidoreductase RnfA subunit|uniref:Uncharacterized protein n=1 Tax=candidate division WOR-3 bacterium TaxID=2052148 RepID=A0A7V3VUA9_UNCW3